MSVKSITYQLQTLTIVGSESLLNTPLLGLFCSIQCPGSIILKTYDLAGQLKEKNIPVVSGFHSPIEQEVLVTLLRGSQPVIVCPARNLQNMRIPAAYKPHIESGRLLLVSPFPENVNRVTEKTAQGRNRFVAALAERVFVAYAAPEGKTEQFCRELITAGKPLFTFESEYTRNLLELGAKVFEV